MLAEDEDDIPNNSSAGDIDMDYLQEIEAALLDAQGEEDAAHQQHPPMHRRQRSAEDSDYDITRSPSDPPPSGNRVSDEAAAASKPQQRSKHLATGLVAHAHAKRKFAEVIEKLTDEENKRNKLLLKTLPESTAVRYKYHLDVTFKPSAVRNLITHLSGTNDANTGIAAPSRGRHSTSSTSLPPLFSQLMKTIVMYVTESARELQLADMQAAVLHRQVHIPVADAQVLGDRANEVYDAEAVVSEIEAVKQELRRPERE